MLSPVMQQPETETTVTDEDLMLRYGDGDYSAFEQLYQRHRSGLMGHLRRQLSQASIAEELYQEIWLRIIKARQNYQPSALFKTYLYRIAHNVLVDYYRRQSNQPQADSLDEPLDNEQPDNPSASLAAKDKDSDTQLAQGRQLQTLRKLIAALPFEQRESFLLKEDSGLSLQEVAEVTGTSIETAKSRIRYAVKKLRDEMEVIYGRG